MLAELLRVQVVLQPYPVQSAVLAPKLSTALGKVLGSASFKAAAGRVSAIMQAERLSAAEKAAGQLSWLGLCSAGAWLRLTVLCCAGVIEQVCEQCCWLLRDSAQMLLLLKEP